MIQAIIVAAIGAGALGALAYLYWRVTRAGKIEAENDALRKTLDVASHAREVEKRVDNLSPDAVARELQQYRRD